jgi:cobalt-precorrin-5B (C1)-methyltransferase
VERDPIRRIPIDPHLVRRELGVDLPTARYLIRTGLVTTEGARVLRRGPTTGTCATAAAKAAAIRLLEGRAVSTVRVRLPIGAIIGVRARLIEENPPTAEVRKPGNDDRVDATAGARIRARVEPLEEPRIEVRAGPGVGRLPDGRPAISEAARAQIRENLTYLIERYGTGLRVTISVVDGERLAERTLAHRHGITGGISILGTKGLVDPNSEEAIEGTIRHDLRYVENVPCLVTGYRTLRVATEELGLPETDVVNCQGRYDLALPLLKEGVPTDDGTRRFDRVLILGMPGKLLKLAAGVYNTHARVADARYESLLARLVETGHLKDAQRLAQRGPGTMVAKFLRTLDPDTRRDVLQRTCELIERRVQEDHDLRCGCAAYLKTDDGIEVVTGPEWRRLAP